MSIFEIIYFAALVVEMVIRAPINQKRKKITIREQRGGAREQVLFGLLSLAMMGLPILYSATRWLDFANYALPAWASWVGVALIAGSLLVFWRSHADLGVNWSPSLEIREQHELITRGIYGRVRHPMYTSLWLWVLAQALLLPNWVAGFLSVVFFFAFYFTRVGAEEKMMLDTFGAQYQEYRKRTGAIFPRLRM
jgi:protein-S-isoprenylcysteine O-methyltransferase Ste14